MPTIVHKNLVPKKSHSNDILSIGIAGRIKLTKRITLVGEYYHFITPAKSIPTINNITPVNPIGLGLNIETGGHVFQLFLTNAQASFNEGFITETVNIFKNGGIFFGFNITRNFSL